MDNLSLDEIEKYEYLEQAFRQQDRKARRQRRSRTRLEANRQEVLPDLTDFDDSIADFVPTYAAALDPLHYERSWIIDNLGPFYRDNVIKDVTRLVKGGKEANVYCCIGGEATRLQLVAAKIYRPRMLRHLRNDAMYKEGRILRDHAGDLLGHREARAMINKTRFGKKLSFLNWIGHEFTKQQELFSVGADVPEPVAMQGNTILMDFLGDEWAPAPALNEIRLEKDEARYLFERIIFNVRLMMDHYCVHGDLSAYNILYHNGKIVLIDFPQMVDPRSNQHAEELLYRDVQRVCDYFTRYGVAENARGIVRNIWGHYTGANW